jgi:hypothetical protein
MPAAATTAAPAAAQQAALPAAAPTAAPAAAVQEPAMPADAPASADTAAATHDLEARAGRRPSPPRPHPNQPRHRPRGRLPNPTAPCRSDDLEAAQRQPDGEQPVAARAVRDPAIIDM